MKALLANRLRVSLDPHRNFGSTGKLAGAATIFIPFAVFLLCISSSDRKPQRASKLLADGL